MAHLLAYCDVRAFKTSPYTPGTKSALCDFPKAVNHGIKYKFIGG